MAEPLKRFFSPALVRSIGASVAAAHPSFDQRGFERMATRGLDALELLDRGRHIMEALRAHLPPAYEDALAILLRSLGPASTVDENLGGGMAPFFYLPHVDFIRTHGVHDFERSMKAQEELTKRFTCEWSIRPFLERYPDRTLVVLRRWARSGDPHVRRLVSEGTRIRLPWASRIPTWEGDLDRVIALLEMLRDDPSSMVRRSVANNLNDIAKVDPARVTAVAARWLEGATPERRALVERGLRSLVKRGDRKALGLLGFGGLAKVAVAEVAFAPAKVAIGESTVVSFTLTNRARAAASLLVDLAVHFQKARGTSAKVFKIKRVELAPGASASFSKRVSLAVHTTRKPQLGPHQVEVLVNGVALRAGQFDVVPARKRPGEKA